MKERFNVEVTGIRFSIVSDDGAEHVKQTVDELNRGVQSVLDANSNYSKLDAVTLCALDYCGELLKADAKIKNLEAQIEILEANMRRTRAAKPSKKAVAEAAEAAEAAEVPETVETEQKASEVPETAPAQESTEESRGEKFRQLEALLGSQLKLDLDRE